MCDITPGCLSNVLSVTRCIEGNYHSHRNLFFRDCASCTAERLVVIRHTSRADFPRGPCRHACDNSRARAVPNRSPAVAKMGSEEVPSGVLTLAESGIAPQAGAPPLEGYDLGFEPTKEDCLLVIDLQVDFMPGGALEVPGGTEVFPLVNAMIEKFERVVMSQDWHPPAHSSFASQHEGKAPYDVTSMPYGKQTLWPDHCVQGTSGCVTRVGFFQPHRARLPRLYNPARDPSAHPSTFASRSTRRRTSRLVRPRDSRARPEMFSPRPSRPHLDVDDTPSTSPPFPARRPSLVSREFPPPLTHPSSSTLVHLQQRPISRGPLHSRAYDGDSQGFPQTRGFVQRVFRE